MMTGSINKVTLLGYLGARPEVRTMANGGQVCGLRLATSTSWKDQTGARKERTEWHRVTIYNEHLIKVASEYLDTGDRVHVEGALRTRKYEKNGQTHYATEVVLERFRGELLIISAKRDSQAEAAQEAGAAPADLDDEIPF